MMNQTVQRVPPKIDLTAIIDQEEDSDERSVSLEEIKEKTLKPKKKRIKRIRLMSDQTRNPRRSKRFNRGILVFTFCRYELKENI